MSYGIVSSIFDLKRFHPGVNRWRSVERYIKMFKYVNELNVDTVLFIEPHLIPRFNEVIKPSRNNLVIIPYKLEDLPLYKKIKDLNDLHPVINGKHVDKYFTSVINSKFYLVDLAREHIQHSHLIWLDSGIAHIGTIPKEQFYEDVKLNIHPDNITIVLMKAIHGGEISNLKSHLQLSLGKIAAGIAIIPTTMVTWYAREINEIFNLAVFEAKVMCYEEQLMAVVLAKYPNKFKFIYGDYGSIFKNMRHITIDLSTVINNLAYCRECSLNVIAYDIIIKLIASIGQANNKIIYHQFHEFCYNAQIVCYYMDKPLSTYFSYLIGFLYYNTPEGNEYFKSKYDHIKENIKFVDIDLDNDELFTESRISDIDTYNILWSII